MGAKINLIGQKYGRLTVIDECKERDKNNRIMWLCECECGNQKIVRGADLRAGKILSCGCLGKEKRLEGKKKVNEEKKNNPGFRNDLTGQVFGRLTVLSFDKEETITKRQEQNNMFSWWKCQCDCGNIISVKSTLLTTGATQSCGCLQKEKASENMKKGQPLGAEKRFIDLTGQRFEKLVVLKRYEYNDNSNKTQWVCQCDCGNIIVTQGQSLIKGYTKSCGCIKNSFGEYYINDILINNSINFVREYKFQDLKDKSYLRFDFALLNDNNEVIKLIEYDGRQHVDKNSEWHTDTLIKHDNMKNEYCKIHNIPLLRISYLDLENITIDKLLNETTIS